MDGNYKGLYGWNFRLYRLAIDLAAFYLWLVPENRKKGKKKKEWNMKENLKIWEKNDQNQYLRRLKW